MEIQPLTAQIDVVIDKQTLINKINQLQQTIEILTAQKTQLEQDLATATTQIESLNAQIQSLTSQITDLQSQISNLHSNLDLINGEIVENKTEYLLETKNQIKNAIINKWVSIDSSDTFRSYATKINQIPSAPVGDKHTLLLMHFDESTTKDSSIYSDEYEIKTYGTPTLNTSIKKFGNSSLYLDGSSTVYVKNNFFPAMNSTTFTFETWLYPTFNVSSRDFAIFAKAKYQAPNSYLTRGFKCGHIKLNNDTLYFDGCTDCYVATSYTALTQNTWHHLAITRDFKIIYIFIDGLLKSSVRLDSTSNYNYSLDFECAPFVIGAIYWNGSYNFQGYIDEFRVSDVCRYTENFTPPTEPFSI